MASGFFGGVVCLRFFNQERLTSEHSVDEYFGWHRRQRQCQKSSAFAVHDCCKRTDIFVL